jgi:hypothetical protein
MLFKEHKVRENSFVIILNYFFTLKIGKRGIKHMPFQ